MSDAGSTVTLPARATIADASALKETLRDALDRDLAPRLDACAVDAADTAVYQLLVAFAAEVRSRGGTPAWAGASAPFVAGARLLGVSHALGLAED